MFFVAFGVLPSSNAYTDTRCQFGTCPEIDKVRALNDHAQGGSMTHNHEPNLSAADQQAVEHLHAKYKKLIDNIIRGRLIRCGAFTVDMFESTRQSTWAHILANSIAVSTAENPEAFIATVATRQVIDKLRMNGRRLRRFKVSNELVTAIMNRRNDEQTAENQSDLMKRIEEFLAEEPAEFQELIKARFVDGKTFSEIARVRKETESAVAKRVQRWITKSRERVCGAS